MATITNANLVLTHDHTKKTVKVVATCKVNFTVFEVNQMKIGLKYKLGCKLFGDDIFFDNDLFTFAPTYFPDGTPTNPENAKFETILGEGVLNEDIGTDEVYAKFTLINLFTLVKVEKKSNVVSHKF